MKNVKNMNDIAAIATAKVNELIANGFIFNFGTMAGSQGDDFKADLTKDGITYRIRVYREHRSGKSVEVFEVRKYEQNFADDSFNTLWNHDGEVVESHVWYRMENRNGYVYTDDADAFENARELHYTRVANSRNNDTKNAISPEKVIEKIRAHRGYKRAQIEDIKRIVRKNDKYTGKVTYVVEFKNLVSKTADFKLKLN
nr:MAG TPA: hypothetical protein [Caudoviricetes sp.]